MWRHKSTPLSLYRQRLRDGADAGGTEGGIRMSVAYLKQILTGSRDIVCLLGRAPAIAGGCDFYREDYAYEIETKYGRSPGEIFSSSF